MSHLSAKRTSDISICGKDTHTHTEREREKRREEQLMKQSRCMLWHSKCGLERIWVCMCVCECVSERVERDGMVSHNKPCGIVTMVGSLSRSKCFPVVR